MAWTDQLQPASFRGVPFAVSIAESGFGRRVAVHEYPYRDKPWVEDLGRATRKISIRGFLVSNSKIYGGGDVIAQRARLVGAAETAGPGTLVHPTLGRLTVSLLTIATIEKTDDGRYFEVNIQFLETGEVAFPTVGSATQSLTGLFSSALNSASSASFLTRAVVDLQYGASVVNQVVSTATKWASPAISLVRDATNLSHLASNLPGVFGRYFGGANVGGLGIFGSEGEQLVDATTSIADLITAGSAARALVQTAIDTVISLAGQSDPTAFASAAQSLTAAVRNATNDPNDGLRLLQQLAVSPAADPTTTSPVGLAMADIQTGCNDLFRRAAAASLAESSARYQPSSYDDAVRVRTIVVDLLDSEITIAGDQAEDQAFSALRDLRVAVVQDLTDRGANLATIKTFTEPSSLPSLYLANKLYRDAKREDQLVRQINPRHPLFCPAAFRALSA